MRHARAEDLDRLEDLLGALRALPLVERSRGVFYRKGRAFLHFHEDAGDLFADIRGDADFDRFDVTGATARAAFLAEAQRRAA